MILGGGMTESEPTWVARVTPLPGVSVTSLLGMPLGLDVWERRPGFLVVAAPESRLAELERRLLARVDRWATREQYEERMADRTSADDG